MGYKAKGYKVKQQGWQSAINGWVRKCNRENLITNCGWDYKVQENYKRVTKLPYSWTASFVIYLNSFWEMLGFIYSLKYLPVEIFKDIKISVISLSLYLICKTSVNNR